MTSARLHGLKWIGLSLGLCVAVVVLLLLINRLGFMPEPMALVGLAVPFVPLFGGVVEIITGISLFELARRWDGLKGWQRGVYGTTIVILALLAILCVVGGYFTFLDYVQKKK